MRQTKANLTEPAKQLVQPDLSHEAARDHWLTNLLAQRVMGWRIARGRYLKAQRSWIPQWRFAPFIRVEDAFQLLNRASRDFRLTASEGSAFIAEVRVGDRTGRASGETKRER